MPKSKTPGDHLYVVMFKAQGDLVMGVRGPAPSLEDAKGYSLPEHPTPAHSQERKAVSKKDSFLALHSEASEAVSALRALHRVTKLISTASAPLQFEFTLRPALTKHASLAFSDSTRDIYEVHRSHTRAISGALRDTASGIEAAIHFPKLLLIGLVSDYDVFLQKLIKAAFTVQPKLRSGIERNISLGELSEFSSVEEASEYLIEREIDALLHEDHLSQMRSINKLFNIKIDTEEPRIKSFLELCERRNLYTHNAGLVNARYLNKCSQLGIDTSNLVIGQHLDVTDDYLKEALLICHELKIKLCQYSWRKLVPNERAAADCELNDAAFRLLQEDDYLLAERILEYGIKHTGQTEEKTRLMMIVNHANAMKLGGKSQRAIAELDKIDWSASSDAFRISVAAVKDDLSSVIGMLDSAVKGNVLTEAALRTWPVFKTMRGESIFQDKFRQLFGSELVAVSSLVAVEGKGATVSTKPKGRRKLHS